MCKLTLHVAQILNTKQLQHYIPYKLGLFQVYNVNTLHEGDNKDNNNNNNNKNVIKKEAMKILKYKYLIIEIQHMWNVKLKMILE
jgi:hypothetical protein